ncbi:MAG: serine/threonine protein kinase [Archangiaceae bacterium]|nr:serine/threonine protein kinase [Archangiaceae bacterium]
MEVRFGKYVFVRSLGVGGMGEVFLAREVGLGDFQRFVAVKQILPHLASDARFLQMFLNEARVAARLNHPNLVHLFELGEADGTFYQAMEYVHGRSARALHHELMRVGRPLDPLLAAHLGAQVLHGLHHAHTLLLPDGSNAAIVHRDVSADNVLVAADGQVKLLDFGVAKALADEGTRSGTIKGKWRYTAPEIFLGHPATPQSDLYGVGVMLYELLTGRPPFSGPTDAALMHAVLHDALAPVQRFRPEVPPALAQVVEQAMARSPEQRFASARQMALALDALSPGTDAQGALAGLLREHFPDLADAAAFVAQAPHRTAELSAPGKAPALARTIDESATVTERAPRPRRWGRGVALAAGLALLGVGTGALVLRPSQPATKSEVVKSEVPPSPVVPVAAVEPPSPAPPPAARPARGAARATRAAQSSGLIDLQVVPWAEVFEGGRSLGITPLDPLTVAPGSHRLVLRNSELGIERSVVVEVSAGRTSPVRINLQSLTGPKK